MGLRDGIDIRTSTGLADQYQDEDLAAGMGSLRRGWAAGRIGNELNPMRTEQLDAEIAGDVPRAATLRDQIGMLEKRQQMYAPEVGRVEDIHGLRDAAGWLGGQVGQGAASMVDPMAVSAGLSAAGRVAGAVPHPMARLAGKAAQGAALVLPGFMAKDQLTGEFIGEAQGDADLMARTSPQSLRDMAGNYGALAAIPDSILPGIVGRQLGGFGLGKGISKLGTGARAALGAVGEGATEALQSAGSQYARGELNPNRDTSGDFMENVNSFAGGAVGGAPFAGAGALADSGYRRAGDTAVRLGTKAGEVYDLARDAADPYIAKGIERAGLMGAEVKARSGKVIDLLADQEGKVTPQSVMDTLRTATTPAGKLSDDELSVLKDEPPGDIIMDDAKVGEWLNANGEKRLNLVAEKLQAMDDPEAGEMLQRIGAETDPDRQHAALSAAADFLISKSPVGRASTRAEKLAGFSEMAGALLGKAAVGAGKGAVSLGKSVASGVKEGMGKKNAQVAPTDEDFATWRERTYGVAGKPAAVLVAGGADFNGRAELAAGYTADMAKKAKFNVRGGQALARQATFNLADMVDTAGADITKLAPRLNRITADFADIYKARAPEVLSQLGKIMGPEAAPAIKHMLAELEQQAAPTGRQYVKDTRAALADQMVNLVGVSERAALMKEGINLHDPAQAEQMLGLMEDFADGIGAEKSRGMRAALDQRFGKDGVDQIIGLLNGQAEKLQPGEVVDDRGQIEGDDFEKAQGEKTMAKGSGPKVYKFGNGLSVRTNNETRDPFAPTETDAGGVVRRPSLIKKGQKLFGGADAIEKAVTDLKKQLQDDPDYPDHDNHDVRARSAWDVMKESGTPGSKIIQLYRDYMRMERDNEKLSDGERKYATQQARLANLMLQDGETGLIGMNIEGGLTEEQAKGSGIAVAKKPNDTKKTSPEDRVAVSEAAEAYFKERFMVVGEQLSNRDPSKLAVTEVLDMHKGGMGLMERARLQENPTQAISDANLLVFKSDAAKEGGEVVIPAGKLVKWVREQRGADGPKNLNNSAKDAAYLADVSEGIAALVGSGFVKGLPYKLNEKGQRESFEKGIAPSLRLATKTYGAMQFADKQRRANRTEDTIVNPDQELVAEDQARNEDTFTPDPLEEVEPGANGERMHKRELETNRQGLRVDRSGRRNPDPKTDKDDKTPLDFFPARKDGEAPGDFDDQQWLSRQTVKPFEGRPEPKMTAVARAEFRARELMAAFAKDPEAATEQMLARVRAAKRPGYVKPDSKAPGAEQVVGGAHYIAPIAYLVQRDRAAGMNLGESEQQMFDHLRKEAATVLLNAPEGELSATQMLNIAKMMSTDPRKVNGANVRPMLEKLAGREVVPMTAKQEPAAKGIMARAISQRQAYLDNPPADYTTAKAKEIGGWAQTQLDRIKQELPKADDARTAALEDYQVSLRQMVKKAASVVEGDASLTGFEGTAQEVANAGLPKGQATLSGARNAQGGASRLATQAEMDEATAYAKKVLGPKIKVEFKAITGYSGEFIDATNTIEISTTAAAGTLGTLYHEAMHVFFRDFVKGNPNVQVVFESLVNDPRHLEKLHALLDGFPAAQAQLTSGEERLAYTYQFWKAGLLQVDVKAKTWLQKIGKFFRRVFGMVRDSEKALELFEAFDNGKMSEPSAAGQVIAKALGQGSMSIKMRRNLDGVVQGLAALTMPAGEILNNSLSPTARKLSAMMFTNPGEESHGHMERGLLNARRSVALQYDNLAKRIMEDLSDTDQERVQKYLQSEAELADIPLGAHREAVKGIRNALDRFHQYLTESGLKIGKVEKYYPTVWSVDALLNKKPEFINMLVTKYAAQMAPLDNDPAKAAERIWKSLVDRDGVDAHLPAQREDGVLNPFFASQEMRTLPWLKGADKEAFLDKNMLMTLSRYFTQGAHSAEYTRRFGEGGVKLELTLKKINDELTVASHEKMKRGEIKDEPARAKWVGRQMRDISQSVGAMEGALGKDVSPTMRKFNSWMTVYQNVRLLPMSLFSSFVDPLALVARGAPMAAAYETFVYGMREVFRTWGDAFRDMPAPRQKDEWRKLAEHIGAAETAMFSHFVAEQYSSVYMSAGAKKINDKMFVLNGMEAWNRGTRVMATKWAVRFLEQHAGLPDKVHSARWLKELGLDPGQLTLDGGRLVTDRHHLMALKGISLDQATREIAPVHAALNRWVEGAVLTPNAAQRPGWSSDPNYATLFHLKQFSYSFHQTILKRAVNEFKHGNMAPVGALAAFIPTMITADVMKGLIQGGGELPAYMKGMDAGDWFTHGVQRAGLLGIGSIGMDAETDLASLGGPAVEQAIDGMRDGFGEKTLLKAMPLNSLYGEMFKGTANVAAVNP